jgi:hypothetical protein
VGEEVRHVLQVAVAQSLQLGGHGPGITDPTFTFGLAVYNLVRMRRLVAQPT